VDSCLFARIISPSVDNSQDVKKLSWEWFNLILLGVPKASRIFDLDPKSQNSTCSNWKKDKVLEELHVSACFEDV